MDRRAFVAALSAAPVVLASPALRAQERAFTPDARALAHVRGRHAARDRGCARRHAGLGAGAVRAGRLAAIVAVDVAGQHARGRRSPPIRSYGAQMVHARWDDGDGDAGRSRSRAGAHAGPRDRLGAGRHGAAAQPGRARARARADRAHARPTASCARPRQEATRGKRGDVDKVRALYDWVVTNTHREPTVRGCGIGDIRAMLETGNLSRQVRGHQCAVRRPVPRGRHSRARPLRHPRRTLGLRLPRARRGSAGHLQGAALPRRGLARRLRLGGDGPGGRRQGDAAGDAAVAQGSRRTRSWRR